MKFYKFETLEQFQTFVNTSEVEFVKDGIQFSVIGKIANGGEDEEGNPTFKEGWHVNASDAVDGWEAMEVNPNQPIRIFG